MNQTLKWILFILGMLIFDCILYLPFQYVHAQTINPVPVFTAVSGTTCTTAIDNVNKLVDVSCGVSPNPLTLIISFNPHVLENNNSNSLYLGWGNVAMMFSKPTPASNMNWSYGTPTTNQGIANVVSGNVAITF